MKQQILFIQGGGEGAYEEDGHLVASLRSTLGDVYELHYPQMPNESDPDYEPWKVQIKQELAGLEGEVILIGHSFGSSFLLKYLAEEKIEKPIAGIFLMATPYWGGDGWQYEGYERVTLPAGFASKLPSGVPIFLYPAATTKSYPLRIWPCMPKNFHGQSFASSTDAGISSTMIYRSCGGYRKSIRLNESMYKCDRFSCCNPF